MNFRKGQMVKTLDDEYVGIEALVPFKSVPVNYFSYLNVMEEAVKEFIAEPKARLTGFDDELILHTLDAANELLLALQQVQDLIQNERYFDALYEAAGLEAKYIHLNQTKLYRSVALKHLSSSRGGKGDKDHRATQQDKMLKLAQDLSGENHSLRINKLCELIAEAPGIGADARTVKRFIDQYKNRSEVLPTRLWDRGRPSKK